MGMAGVRTRMFSLPMQENDVDMSTFRSILDECANLCEQQQQTQSLRAATLLPTSATGDPFITTAAITSHTEVQASHFSLNNSVLNAPSGITQLPTAWHRQEVQQLHQLTPRGVSKLTLNLLLK
jgi:hypothetical protein